MKKLDRDERFIIGGELYMFFLLGIYTLLVGALIPHMRNDYGITYEQSGFLVSANSIGMIAMNVISSYTAILFGLKRAYVIQHALIAVGLLTAVLSGNFIVLLIGMAFVGFARGSTSNYSNQIVNDITKSNPRTMILMGVAFAIGACLAPFVMTLSADVAGDWRYANYGMLVAAAIGIVITLNMKIGKDGAVEGETKRGDLSFFKRKKFWVALLAMFCYTGIEMSTIGWTATFFIDTQNTTTQFASTMTTLLWASILVGRIICSFIANRTTTAKFILYLSIGAAVFMALFVSNVNLTFQVIATIGIGLFLSGTYSTILADAGYIFREYRLAFGYFFMLSGLGPVTMPSVVGLISERRGVQTGMRTLAVAAAALLVISIFNARLDKKKENNE